MAPGELVLPGKVTASEQRAQKWGIRTARKIATVLGAEKAANLTLASEFLLEQGHPPRGHRGAGAVPGGRIA